MNAEIFARWLNEQGHKVIKTESSYWYDAGPRVLQAFPFHWCIQPGEGELANLFRQHRIVALRYSAPVHSPDGCISYHVVYDDPEYTIEGLDRRSRQNIRIGLRNCVVEPVPLERLAEEGWYLEKDTAERQGRQPSMDLETWQRRYWLAAELPGFEAWGAIVNGRIVASLLTFQIGECCEMISQQCYQEYLSSRVNNALSYVVTKTMIEREQIFSIFYTLQSLDAPASIDTFKFRMGYRAKPVRQRVIFHPFLEPLAKPFAQSVISRIRKLFSSSRVLAKAEGMYRFYNQGLRPVEDQDWPEFLVENKEKILRDI